MIVDDKPTSHSNNGNDSSILNGRLERGKIKTSVSMLDFREVADIQVIETVLHRLAFTSEKTGANKTDSEVLFIEDLDKREICCNKERKDDMDRNGATKMFNSPPFAVSSREYDIQNPLRKIASTGSFLSYKTNRPGLSDSDRNCIVKKKSSMKRNPSFTRKPNANPTIDPIPENKLMKRNVSFTNLCVRQYGLTLGDNPAVSFGPPLSLTWEYEEERQIGLEDYEAQRGKRRTSRQFNLNYVDRRRILEKDGGFTEEELRAAVREIEIIQKNRRKTVTNLYKSKYEEALESAQRKMKRILGTAV